MTKVQDNELKTGGFLRPLFVPASHPFRLGGLLMVSVFVLDQLSKWLILHGLDLPARRIVELTPFFNLRMAWNPGVSFGLFQADTLWGRLGLIFFALGVVVFLLLWLRKAPNWLTVIAIGLIVGGAVGNVWDRLHYGAVVDFLDFHLLGYHFYTFNVADAAISTGVALLVVEALFGPKRDKTEKRPEDGADQRT